jgi:hypothetical protein
VLLLQRNTTSGAPCLLPAVYRGRLFYDCVDYGDPQTGTAEICPTQASCPVVLHGRRAVPCCTIQAACLPTESALVTRASPTSAQAATWELCDDITGSEVQAAPFRWVCGLVGVGGGGGASEPGLHINHPCRLTLCCRTPPCLKAALRQH